MQTNDLRQPKTNKYLAENYRYKQFWWNSFLLQCLNLWEFEQRLWESCVNGMNFKSVLNQDWWRFYTDDMFKN